MGGKRRNQCSQQLLRGTPAGVLDQDVLVARARPDVITFHGSVTTHQVLFEAVGSTVRLPAAAWCARRLI